MVFFGLANKTGPLRPAVFAPLIAFEPFADFKQISPECVSLKENVIFITQRDWQNPVFL